MVGYGLAKGQTRSTYAFLSTIWTIAFITSSGIILIRAFLHYLPPIPPSQEDPHF